MKILVTGGTGLVGRNLLDFARATGHAFEIYAPPSQELNLLDRASTEEYVAKHNPELIIHCAGRVGGIQANVSNPVEFLIENLDMARNIIGAAHRFRVKRLINMGTSCMYPRDAEIPITEDKVLAGVLEQTNEGYAMAKSVAAKYAFYIQRENRDLKYKTFIPCNLFGRYDNFHPETSHMIPAAIHKVHTAKVNGAETVEIWGDGTARREFMDAYDLSDFVFFAIDNFDKVPPLINVGLGYDLSVNDYYKTVAEVLGYKGTFTHNLSRPVGVKQKVLSMNQAEYLGWKAKRSLRESIEKAYEYYLASGGLGRFANV